MTKKYSFQVGVAQLKLRCISWQGIVSLVAPIFSKDESDSNREL